MSGKRIAMAWVASGLLWFAPVALAEVIYLHNGDVLHGSVIGASEEAVTLETPYGNLVIPKVDIRRIDYQGADPSVTEPETAGPAPNTEDTSPPASVSRDVPAGGGATIALDVRGDSFWYAFPGTVDQPADARIRLRLFVAGDEAAVLLDDKHDTVDGDTKYNSFTFAPEDTQVIATTEGYRCRVEKIAGPDGPDGILVLLDVPRAAAEQRVLLRMMYQVNEGSLEFPRWTNVLTRSFPVPLEPGRQTLLVLQQDATGLDFTGFFRKTMKNVESFQIRVLSSEVRNP